MKLSDYVLQYLAEQGVRQGIDGGDQIRRWALVHRAIITEDRSGPT
jgi:hypothetical protein